MFIQLTVNPDTLLWTLFHYMLSKWLCYYIAVTSLADAFVIYSIRQLLLCIVRRIFFTGCPVRSRTRSLNARQHIRKRIEGSSLTPPSDVRFIGNESYTQDFHSGSTGSRHSEASFLVGYGFSENIDNLRQAGPSLVTLNDIQISEGLATDKKVMVSTSLTA